jgi:uncharacterized protein YecT (DUF1311 family)
MRLRFYHVLVPIILLVGSVCGKDGDPPMLLATAPSGAFRLLWSGKGTPVSLVPAQATQPAEPLPAVNIDHLTHPSELLDTPPLTFISPDERWIFVQRSSAGESAGILYRRAEATGPQGLPRYLPATAERFDTLAWQFRSQETKVSMADIRKPNEAFEILFGGWSADSGRLLFGLHNTYTAPLWCCYFNTQTQKFERTERLLRAAAQSKWDTVGRHGYEDGCVLNPESIGQEGPETPAQERFTKADTELNRIYSELMRKLTPSVQAQLRSEEQRWLIERETFASIHAIQSWSLHPKARRTEGLAIFTERRVAELTEH